MRRAAFLKTTERDFQRQVIDLAHLFRWTVAHFRPGMTKRGTWCTAVQGDGAGFPDLVLIRPPKLIVAELKVGTNKPTAAQETWLDLFRGCGVPAYVWRPEMWAEIVEKLT